MKFLLAVGMLLSLMLTVPAEPAAAHDVNCAPKFLELRNVGSGMRAKMTVTCAYPAMTYDIHPEHGRGHVARHKIAVEIQQRIGKWPWSKHREVAANATRWDTGRKVVGAALLTQCKRGKWYRPVGTHIADGWKGIMPYTLYGGWVKCT